jgi:hypothetical protein
LGDGAEEEKPEVDKKPRSGVEQVKVEPRVVKQNLAHVFFLLTRLYPLTALVIGGLI